MPELIGVYPYPISGLQVEKERYGCPVFAAMATGSKEAVKALLKGLVVQPVEDRYCEGNTHNYYEECNQTEIRRSFTFSKRRTILSYSAEFGYKRIVSSLLESDKVDVDLKDPYGRTPLSWAARNGHEAVVKLLLDTGKVDVDLKDPYGWTPLL
jgi:ankyrin repeat protein